MKHRITVIVLFVAALTVAGCGSTEDEGKPTAQSTPQEIQRDHAVPPGAKNAATETLGKRGTK